MSDGDRPRISVLPPEVAARIAAGEVIERPASVVKELVENALDAGAGHIEVEIEGGGVDRIRVHDDGFGIPPDQVADAFERHATSKLRNEQDLFAVRTLGFRGEALASIAAAADVDLTSRPAREQAAAVARLRDGRLERLGSAAAAPGTTVEARDLFAALPARRRFLHTARAETRAVADVIAALALAYPEVAFRLVADGRVVLASPGTGDPRDAIAAVHGAEVASALVPVAAARRDEETGAAAEVTGLAGPPSLHRGSRAYLHLVANGRTITSRTLAYAIEQGYAGLIPAGRHPVALVRITVPPDQVDVNVHPTKAEVRFRHERLVYATVADAIRQALAGSGVPLAPLPLTASWPGGGWSESASANDAPAPGGHAVIAGARPASMLDAASVPAPGVPAGATADTAAPGQPGLGIGARLPMLRPLGQVDATYLVAEAPDGLYLVDQHAAHERVLYEAVLAARVAGRPASQPLLQAVVTPLPAPHAALALAEADALAELGWVIDPTDGAAVILRAVPAALAGRDARGALRDYLDRMEAEERLTGPDRAAASLACRAAVMAGDRIDAEQQRALLQALEACETPHTCPHGRPTMLHLSRAALDRSFGRR
ncbi:MAG: DNA mismatch repair endonuclease MutL [Dehalococcoidia bacterium]